MDQPNPFYPCSIPNLFLTWNADDADAVGLSINLEKPFMC